MQEILSQIQSAVKEIANELKYADLGYSANHNSTGDTQLKLDIKSDAIITRKLSEISSIKALVSEEKDEMLNLHSNVKYIVAYDPLDGSSLVDVNFAVGSIFAIYEDEISPKALKCACYALYGPRLEFVAALNKSVKLYRLDKSGNFGFVKDLKLLQKGKINATGATQQFWSKTHRNFVRLLFDEGYRLRYSGAMVADLHQILLKGGGIFSYPSTNDHPNGKLRIVFEILPFAFIFENLGGQTSDGRLKTLFDLEISHIHATSACFFGSVYEIEKLHQIYGDENE